MHLDLDKLRSLLDILTERDIAEFEHEEEGVRIKIVRGVSRDAARAAQRDGQTYAAPPMHAGADGARTSASPPSSDAPADAVDVTCPFVGTFYRSPTPDTPTFVEVGSVVRTGQTLCIVEAMKLMNEIEAECSGTVVECFAQNGKAVEYGQKLFRIKKA